MADRVISAGLKAAAAMLVALALAGCSAASITQLSFAEPAPQRAIVPAAVTPNENTPMPARPASAAYLDSLIAKYAAMYDVPESLIRRVIARESGYNPNARNGPYYGLMQISYATAQSMGYRGPASGLLDPDTNLRYAVKYLAGAYLVAGTADGAVRHYSTGYYYDAKAKGLLDEVGL